MKQIWPAGWKSTGHYAPGIVSHRILSISGQLPVDHGTGKLVAGEIAAQTRAALDNMNAVLLAAGINRNAVVLCRVYISDISCWDEVNHIYADFFRDHTPARVMVPTRDLHHGALIEIEAIAEMEDAK